MNDRAGYRERKIHLIRVSKTGSLESRDHLGFAGRKHIEEESIVSINAQRKNLNKSGFLFYFKSFNRSYIEIYLKSVTRDNLKMNACVPTTNNKNFLQTESSNRFVCTVAFFSCALG